MQKVKLSYSEWAQIRNYKKVHIIECLLCSFVLTKENHNIYKVTANIYWIAYLLLFIPTLLIDIIVSMWDGGLKYVSLPMRYVTHSYIYPQQKTYDYCEVTWNAKEMLETSIH